jgi:hypothetical protein
MLLEILGNKKPATPVVRENSYDGLDECCGEMMYAIKNDDMGRFKSALMSAFQIMQTREETPENSGYSLVD